MNDFITPGIVVRFGSARRDLLKVKTVKSTKEGLWVRGVTSTGSEETLRAVLCQKASEEDLKVWERFHVDV